MIRKITLLLLVFLGMQHMVNAQYCGFDLKHQHLMATNPAYAQAVNQFNTQWTNWLAAQPTGSGNSLLVSLTGNDSVYEIPVVVHIIDTGGAIGTMYNPTDISIAAMIDYLNQTWAATWSSYPSASTGGTRIPIKFVLAKRDPNCNTTTGITRNDGSSIAGYATGGIAHNTTTGANETSVKALNIWPNNEYYNIWIVNRIDGNNGTSGTFVAGYAYLPPAPSSLDGTIMLASQITPGSITLPHEMGHAFNLLHVFQGGCSASSSPTGSPNCSTDGDFCCDTEPIAQGSPATCPTINSCTGLAFLLNTQKNFMNYSSCQDRFTPNQRDRVLLSLKLQRPGLISSLGATAPPSSTTALPSACIPAYGHTATPGNAGPREVKVTDAGGNPLLDETSGGYITEGNIVYVDKTCKHILQLKAGSTYTFSVTTGASNVAKIYIDYNNDGVLGNSTGEAIALGSGNPHTATVTIPVTSNVVSCTPLRMRVVADSAVTTVDSCNTIQYGQAEDYEATVTGTGSAGATVTISNPPGGGNPSCKNSTLTFTATPSTGATVANYAWFRKNGTTTNNGPSGSTTNTWTSSAFADKDTVWVQMTYTTLCGTLNAISNKVIISRVDSVAPSVTIGLTYGTNPSCIDDSLVVSVTNNVNPGGNPKYQWKVNGVNSGPSFRSTTLPTFDASNLPNNSQITIVMTSNAGFPCASTDSIKTSNTVTITHATKAPTLSIALTSGTNPGCAGQVLTFTATSTVGGKTPTYKWYVNGVLQTSSSSPTYSSIFNNNDVISCQMVSSTACAVPSSVTSNSITVVHTLLTANITIAQIQGGNPACSGHQSIFQASTTNAGANPQFQWLLNGQVITGATSSLYANSNLTNGDQVSCELIATDPCVVNTLDTSNVITMAITHSKSTSVSVSITGGKNPGCLDSLVEFTAVGDSFGTNPNYEWFVNGVPVFNSPVFSTTSLLDGDQVYCMVNQTDGGCYMPDTVSSIIFNMKRTPTPNPPIISLIGNMLVTNRAGTFVWFGPNGRQNTGGSNGIYYPDSIGQYYAVTDSNGCWSKPSNVLRITLLDVTRINMDGVKIYPNPTTGEIMLDWGTVAVTMNIDVYNPVGQHVMHDEMHGQSHKTLNLAPLANGLYYLTVKDEHGKTGTVKVTLAK